MITENDKFKIIHSMSIQQKNKLNIKKMCQLASVSRSGYYAFLKRVGVMRCKDMQDDLDFKMISAAFYYKGWKKGARQIKMRIHRDYGVIMNLKKIRRLMKKYNLVCPIRKVNPVKAMIKQERLHKHIPNIVNRQVNQGKSKKVLTTDISYLTYGSGKRAYLSVVRDASTKMILAWQISRSLELTFVIDTLKQLVEFYGKELDINVVLHSDQGVHYTSYSYQDFLKSNNILSSMSRRGNCLDNATQESFFAILKTEMTLYSYKTYDALAFGLNDYIAYYNYDRPQLGIHKMTPHEYDDYLRNDRNRPRLLPALYKNSQEYSLSC